ncbi:MAG: MFS transporter [Pseudomonadota bacterium]
MSDAANPAEAPSAAAGDEQPTAGGYSKAERRFVLAASVLGSSMAFIDGTAITLALPAIQADLGATLGQMLWVSNAYTLFLAALILVGGAFGDILGRRGVFAVGVGLFALASMGCAMAPSPEFLIAARAIQGVGAALLTPLSLALVSSAFPKSMRGGAIGTWAAASALMTALGPPLGGWLAATISWRWIFFINLPLAAATIAIIYVFTPRTEPVGEDRSIDWIGAFFAVAGLGFFAYGLIAWAESIGVGEAGAVAEGIGAALQWNVALGIGAAGLVAFLVTEFLVKSPMAPPELFLNSRCFTVVNASTFLLYGALGGVFLFYPFFLIEGHGRGSDEVGLSFIGFAIPMALLSRWAGALIDRVGARPPLTIGPLIAALGFALMGLTPVSGSIWLGAFPAMVVFGAGMAVTVPALSTAIFNSSPEERAGAASGVNNAIARAASLFAVAGLGVVAAASFRRSAGEASGVGFGGWADWAGAADASEAFYAAYQSGMQASFHNVILAAIALCVLSAASAAFFLTTEVEGERGRKMEITVAQRFAEYYRGFGRLRRR